MAGKHLWAHEPGAMERPARPPQGEQTANRILASDLHFLLYGRMVAPDVLCLEAFTIKQKGTHDS